MIKNSILIVVFISCCFVANAQIPKCKLVRDTLYYVTFDIRSKSDYPTEMSGVGKVFSISDFNTKNKDAFIRSFYKKLFYTPDIFNGYKKMLLQCFGDSLGYVYLKQHLSSSSLIANALVKHSLKKKLLLESSEIVYFNIVKVSADFWKVDKTNPGISKNSNEADINILPEIGLCYVPFKVYYYKIPNRSIIFN